MTTEKLPPCRHRGGRRQPGVYSCHSPKLVGLPLVNATDCRACSFPDHARPTRAPERRHLFPCAHWGEPLAVRSDRHACSHPRHGTTTWDACQTCPDYLFPYLAPTLSAGAVRRLIALGTDGQPGGWWKLPNVMRAYRWLARKAARETPTPPAHLAGKGIVMVGGGPYFPSAYVAMRVLRHVGCRLPVEMWHMRDEVDDAGRRLLASLDVVCVDADLVAQTQPFRFLEGHWWKGWQLKPFAVAHSRFAEVLFLDADCYPTRDPAFLFRLPAYRRRGAVFWPDLETSAFLAAPNIIWKVFGVVPKNPPLESGQMLIDKRSCWRELQLTLWYNAQADFVYRHLWGDKDTFNLAWNLLGRKFALLHPRAGWDQHTILQYDHRGRVLFQHRCSDKFRLEAMDFASNPQPKAANEYNPRLAHEDFCFRALEDLRRRWNHPLEPSA